MLGGSGDTPEAREDAQKKLFMGLDNMKRKIEEINT